MNIGKQQFEPKANFKFSRVADKKYKTDENLSGVEQIYQDLMSYKSNALVAFWDCATAHYGKSQPSVNDIEETLEEIIENGSEQDIEGLFKEAFKVIDESGFFRLQLKEFWNQLELIDQMEKDEEKKEQMKLGKDMYKKKRKDLLK